MAIGIRYNGSNTLNDIEDQLRTMESFAGMLLEERKRAGVMFRLRANDGDIHYIRLEIFILI